MSIDLGSVNWLAVVIGTVVYFALGALWFAPVTPIGRAWMKAAAYESPTSGTSSPVPSVLSGPGVISAPASSSVPTRPSGPAASRSCSSVVNSPPSFATRLAPSSGPQVGSVALRISAHVMTRVSRAVWTLSMASRAFSRAISCADEVPTMAMPK